jgi:hypothetical protein
MNKRVILLGLAMVLVVAAVSLQTGGILGNFLISEEETTDINYNNLKEAFSSSKIVRELPKDAEITLSFYNFNTGYREWEKSYTIRKGEVVDGKSEDADMDIVIHSKYLKPLNSNNFCEVMQEARNNEDFAAYLKISETSFLWKYKGMMKYRKCFAS